MNKSKSLTISVKENCMNPLLCSGDKLEVVVAKKHLIGRLYLYEASNMDLAVHRLMNNEDFRIRKTNTSVQSKAIARGFVDYIWSKLEKN